MINKLRIFSSEELRNIPNETPLEVEKFLWHIETIQKFDDNSDKIDYIQDVSTGFQQCFSQLCLLLKLKNNAGKCTPENIQDLQEKIQADYPLISKKFQRKKYQKTLKLLTKAVKNNSHRVLGWMIKEDESVQWTEVYNCVSPLQAIKRLDKMITSEKKSKAREIEMAFNVFSNLLKQESTHISNHSETLEYMSIETKLYLAKMHQQNRSFNISDLGIKLEDIPSKLLNIEDLWEKNIKDLYNTAPEAFIKRILDKSMWKRAFVGIMNLCYKTQQEVFDHQSLFDRVGWEELKKAIINLKVKHISLLSESIVSVMSSEEVFVRKYLKKYSNAKLAIKSLWITSENIPAIFKILKEKAPEVIAEIETYTLRDVPDKDMAEYLQSLSAQKIDLQTAAQEKKVQITADNIINSKKKRPHKKSLKKHIKELNEKNQEIDNQILKIVSKLIDGHRNKAWERVLNFCWDFLFLEWNFRKTNVKLLRRFFQGNMFEIMKTGKIEELPHNEFNYLVSKVLHPLFSYSYGNHYLKPGWKNFKVFMEMLIARTDIVSLHPIYLMWLVRKNYMPRIAEKFNAEQSLQLANRLGNVLWIDEDRGKDGKTNTDAYEELYPKISQIKNWESKIKPLSFVSTWERKDKYETYLLKLSNKDFSELRTSFITDKIRSKLIGLKSEYFLKFFKTNIDYSSGMKDKEILSKINRMWKKNILKVIEIGKDKKVHEYVGLYRLFIETVKSRMEQLNIEDKYFADIK